MSKHVSTRPSATNRRPLLLILAGGVSAALLALGANGTLADWTSAVITNSTNSVATAQAVILQETNGAATCASSDDSANNFSCTTINKYGGTASPLSPGQSQTQTVTFKNIGSKNGASFRLAPGTCSYSPTTGTPTPGNLCTNGDLTIAISCSAGATYVSGSAWSDLVYTAAAPPTATKTHTAATGDLNASSQWTCQFTVALSSSANIVDQGITVTQPLTWTLS
ncbi:MAG: hypothetical protein NVSMB48_05160 [Marmoricola sp.]